MVGVRKTASMCKEISYFNVSKKNIRKDFEVYTIHSEEWHTSKGGNNGFTVNNVNFMTVYVNM